MMSASFTVRPCVCRCCRLGALVAVVLSLVSARGAEPDANVADELAPHVDRAVKAIYRGRYDEAEEILEEMAATAPDHPYPVLGEAILVWVRFLYGTERNDAGLLEDLDEKVDRVLQVGRAWLKTHPKDAPGWLAYAAGYGLKSRQLLVQRRWIAAYSRGRKAIKAAKTALELDPELHDALLGLGAYDYYTDTVGRYTRLLSRLLFGGDRKRGIQRLETAAEKGRHMSLTTRLLLAEIHVRDAYGLRDPERSVELLRTAKSEFDDSPMIHAGLVGALYEAGKTDEALDEAESLLARVEDGRYAAVKAGKAHVFLATLHWQAGRQDKAFEHIATAARVRYTTRPSRWAVWANVRAGQWLDLVGRRQEARQRYRAAKACNDPWGYGAVAKRFLKTPFDDADHHFVIWPNPEDY